MQTAGGCCSSRPGSASALSVTLDLLGSASSVQGDGRHPSPDLAAKERISAVGGLHRGAVAAEHRSRSCWGAAAAATGAAAAAAVRLLMLLHPSCSRFWLLWQVTALGPQTPLAASCAHRSTACGHGAASGCRRRRGAAGCGGAAAAAAARSQRCGGGADLEVGVASRVKWCFASLLLRAIHSDVLVLRWVAPQLQVLAAGLGLLSCPSPAAGSAR